MLVEKGIIAEDMPCVGCGYNLRTLSRAGRCPECGEAVFRSVHFRSRFATGEPRRLAVWTAVMAVANDGLLASVACILVFQPPLERYVEYWPSAGVMSVWAFVQMVATWRLTAAQIAVPLRGRVIKIRASATALFLACCCLDGAIYFAMANARNAVAPFLVTGLILVPSTWVLSYQLGMFYEHRCKLARLFVLAERSRQVGMCLCGALLSSELSLVCAELSRGMECMLIPFIPTIVAALGLFIVATVGQTLIAWRFWHLRHAQD